MTSAGPAAVDPWTPVVKAKETEIHIDPKIAGPQPGWMRLLARADPFGGCEIGVAGRPAYGDDMIVTD